MSNTVVVSARIETLRQRAYNRGFSDRINGCENNSSAPKGVNEWEWKIGYVQGWEEAGDFLGEKENEE